jgi:2-dehydro-3-deoxyglucarate aldolase/4-hydroxy-2-oxoheptanedioate aldolase
MISETTNPEVAYILAAAGMDFLMIDMEHSAASMESVQNIVRSARAAGLIPLARVTENQYPYIARVLDMGTMGIMVPRVHTPGQARNAVTCAKYPPVGARGFGARGVITDYEPQTVSDIVDWVNENTLLIVQIESAEAVANVEDIMQVPGIDVALVGPYDLSISLGIPGAFDHPRFVTAIEATFEACVKSGVSPAIHTSDLETMKRWRGKGMCFLMYASEGRMLLDAATEIVRQLVGERHGASRAAY